MFGFLFAYDRIAEASNANPDESGPARPGHIL